MENSPYVVALIALASAIVGLSKGGLPAIGMLPVPVLALVMSPIAAAGLLLPIFVVSDWFGLYAYRKEFDRRNLLILIPTGVVGVGIGWAVARFVPEAAITLLVGLTGLGFIASRFLLPQDLEARPADLPRGIFWGLVSGFTSFVSHSGGPPFQIYVLPQKMPKMVFAGTATILFAVVNAAKLVPYIALGQLNWASVEEILWYAPVAIAATFGGKWLTARVPEVLFFNVVLVSLGLFSLWLTYDGFVKLLV